MRVHVSEFTLFEKTTHHTAQRNALVDAGQITRLHKHVPDVVRTLLDADRIRIRGTTFHSAHVTDDARVPFHQYAS